MSKLPDLSRTSMTGQSSQGIDAPTRKVVGFHVEGATPSPQNDELMKQNIKSGSLSPVIIPPSFQVRPMCAVTDSVEASCCVENHLPYHDLE